MNSFPIKQASSLLATCEPEIQEIIRFNRLMRREPGNADHLLLQGKLLHEEGLELTSSETYGDTIDALCDVVVVAAGYLFIGECDGSIHDGSDIDLALIRKGSIFNSCANCYGDIFAYAVESDCIDTPFLRVSISHAKEALWGVAAYCAIHGIGLKKHLQEVNRSNFSKFVRHSEINKTAIKYEALGVPYEFDSVEDGLIACYVAETVTGKDGKHYPKGKLLKSAEFKEPVFDMEAV